MAAVKTGMLYSAPLIRAVAQSVRACGLSPLVVDPVMVATSGARLLRRDALESLCRDLLPLATVVTPNVPEAEVLSGVRIASVADMERAAEAIGRRFGIACVVKGGHLGGGERVKGRGSRGRDAVVVDVLWVKGHAHVFTLSRVEAGRTHGTGCAFSAALASFLARGLSLPESVRRAQRYVRDRMMTGSERHCHPFQPLR